MYVHVVFKKIMFVMTVMAKRLEHHKLNNLRIIVCLGCGFNTSNI